MPKISLVVCLHKERDLLERLLQHAEGSYDDLVVVHDGKESGEPNWKPAPPNVQLSIDWALTPPNSPLPRIFTESQTPETVGSLREFTRLQGGRFFEHPKIGSLEGQSPFAWWAARHDWILRVDADEFPSEELREWLAAFRSADEPPTDISGYTCIWPLWNGKKQTCTSWPKDRMFLFNRRRVRFFGLIEQTPIPDKGYVPLSLVLSHQPKRKSYGIRNILFRKQAYIWRSLLAESLRYSPTDLPRWRFQSEEWPEPWNSKIRNPIKQAFFYLLWFPFCQMKSMIKAGVFPDISACLNPGLHHFLLQLEIAKSLKRHPGS